MSKTTEENLKWMYEGKNSSIDHEQYLLGKKITSLKDDEQDKGDFIVKSQSTIATGNVSVLEKLDYQSKVREDPLFQIKKNDYEHRKELMSNPLKKKRIQNMLKHALERDLKKNISKQGKYHSSSSDSESSDSDSSSESDEGISKKISSRSLKDDKLRKALKRQLENDLKNQKSKKYRSSSDEEPSKFYKHRKQKHSKISRDSNSESDNKYYQSKEHKEKHSKSKRHSYYSSNEEFEKPLSHNTKKLHQSRERYRSNEKESPEKVKKPGYGLMIVKDGKRSNVTEQRKRRQRRTPSPEPEKPKYVRKQKSGFSQKLTEEEKERKIKEMMNNATWRDDQRKHNVKKYDQEEKKEKEQEERVHELKRKAEKRGGKAKDFLHDMKLHSASVGSLEDTVRRRKHTLSRKF